MRQLDNSNCRTKALTLVEMVVAISMMVIVLATIVPALAGIRNSWDSRQGNVQIVQNARVLADHIYRHLAVAEQITAVSSPAQEKGSIEFVGSDGQTYRYTMNPEGYVQYGLLDSPADLAGLVSRFQFTCYDGNDFDTPTTVPTEIQFVTMEATFVNAAALGKDKTFRCSVYLRRAPVEPREASPFEPGIAVKDTLLWSGSDALIDSYRSSQGAYTALRAGASAVVSTNAIGSGRITLSQGATMRGDVYVGPGGEPDSVVHMASGVITGTLDTLTESVGMAKRTVPASFSGGKHQGEQLRLNGSTTQTLDADTTWNKVQLSGSSTLVIDGDVTVVVNNAIRVEDEAQIKILPGSSLTVFARNAMDITGSARVNHVAGTPTSLRIYMIGHNKDLRMEDEALLCAVVENPDGGIVISEGCQLSGKIMAGRLEGEGHIHMDQDSTF